MNVRMTDEERQHWREVAAELMRYGLKLVEIRHVEDGKIDVVRELLDACELASARYKKGPGAWASSPGVAMRIDKAVDEARKFLDG